MGLEVEGLVLAQRELRLPVELEWDWLAAGQEWLACGRQKMWSRGCGQEGCV